MKVIQTRDLRLKVCLGGDNLMDVNVQGKAVKAKLLAYWDNRLNLRDVLCIARCVDMVVTCSVNKNKTTVLNSVELTKDVNEMMTIMELGFERGVWELVR